MILNMSLHAAEPSQESCEWVSGLDGIRCKARGHLVKVMDTKCAECELEKNPLAEAFAVQRDMDRIESTVRETATAMAMMKPEDPLILGACRVLMHELFPDSDRFDSPEMWKRAEAISRVVSQVIEGVGRECEEWKKLAIEGIDLRPIVIVPKIEPPAPVVDCPSGDVSK